VEDAGVPTQIGHLTDSKKHLKDAVKWFLKRDPVRVQSILCRTFDSEVLNQYFTRHHVASLLQSEIDDWMARCHRILKT